MGGICSRLLNTAPSRGRILLGTACVGFLGSVWLWRFLQAEKKKEPVCVVQADHSGNIRDDYTVESRKLGEGSYASVFKGSKKDTSELVAIKQVSLPLQQGAQIEGRVAQEIDIMKSLVHPHIIRLHETYLNKGIVCLVMELAEGGELFARIIGAGHFADKPAAHGMRQILSAHGYCHSQKICVRSVKPEDIVCMTKEPVGEVVLKLIDFGLSRRFEPGVPMTTKVGTPYYVAPQILAGKYDQSCDLWSCGVVMYVLMVGYPPFYGETDAEVLSKVRLGNYSFNSADWKKVSEEAKMLIRGLLKMNPSARITADQALGHAWFQAQLT